MGLAKSRAGGIIRLKEARLHQRLVTLLLAALLALPAVAARAGPTLDHVAASGFLTCGVSPGLAGFARADGNGNYAGFDVDLCRAIAAAIFGTPDKIRFLSVDIIEDFLASSDIDLVLRGLTWTFAREVGRGLRFGPVIFYDGQALLVRKRSGLKRARDLAHRPVCVAAGTGALPNLARWFADRNLALKAMASDDFEAGLRAFFAGRCAAVTGDASELAAVLIAQPGDPDVFVILPERLSKEPLAPLMRQGDDRFFDIVRWTIFALIDAEELGVTAANVDAMAASPDPRIASLLAPAPAELSFLAPRWARDAIKSAGNYGEIYARNLGAKSRARLARGLNALWRDGGLLYAPPVR